MEGYRLGLYEKAMPDELSLEEKLLLAKKIGFDYVEISIDETEEKISRLDFDKKRKNELHQFMTEQGLSPLAGRPGIWIWTCRSGRLSFPGNGGRRGSGRQNPRSDRSGGSEAVWECLAGCF